MNALRALIFILSLHLSAFASPVKIDAQLTRFLSENASSSIPVLVTYRAPKNAPTTEQEMIQQVTSAEKEVFAVLDTKVARSTLWIAGGTITRLNPDQLRGLLHAHKFSNRIASVTALTRKGKINSTTRSRQLDLDYADGLKKIGLPAVRNSHPDLDGRGVRVGIVDTGMDPTHPDLQGRVKAFRDFINPQSTVAYDDNSHGTHVAGTIAGGSTSGTVIGIAPAADLIIAKAFTAKGDSQEDQLLQALQWAADPDGNPQTNDGAQIISSSWNVDGDFHKTEPGSDPFCIAIDNLAKLGITAVFAAGNDGDNPDSVLVPGACPGALTVGASDENDEVPSFSSRGPTTWKSITVAKPEIVAPGVDVYSSVPNGKYDYKSGTSMATPHVSGALALLIQAKPSASPDTLRQFLLQGAVDLGPSGADSVSGFGRLDLNSWGSQCPELKGTYLCKKNDYRTDTFYDFNQVEVSKVWQFTITATPVTQKTASSLNFQADGIQHDVTDQVSGAQLRVTARCEQGSLQVSGEAGLSSPSPIHFSETLSITSAGDLSNISIDIHGQTMTEVCSRQGN